MRRAQESFFFFNLYFVKQIVNPNVRFAVCTIERKRRQRWRDDSPLSSSCFSFYFTSFNFFFSYFVRRSNSIRCSSIIRTNKLYLKERVFLKERSRSFFFFFFFLLFSSSRDRFLFVFPSFIDNQKISYPNTLYLSKPIVMVIDAEALGTVFDLRKKGNPISSITLLLHTPYNSHG